MADNLPATTTRELGVPASTLTTAPVTLIPDAPMLQKRTYASPMSYVGITRRTTAWVRTVSSNPATSIAAWCAAGAFLAVMYTFLVFYYFVVFVIFGVLTIPFRIVRRSHRKQEHLQRTQLATMQAMLVAQQEALRKN